MKKKKKKNEKETRKKNNRVYFETSEFDERKEIRWKIYYYSFENNSPSRL